MRSQLFAVRFHTCTSRGGVWGVTSRRLRAAAAAMAEGRREGVEAERIGE